MQGICEICGCYANLEKHHVFGGANRKKSEMYGLTVYLCHECHNEPPNGLHFNQKNNNKIKAKYQKKIMSERGWSTQDFIREFGKNYRSD